MRELNSTLECTGTDITVDRNVQGKDMTLKCNVQWTVITSEWNVQGD